MLRRPAAAAAVALCLLTGAAPALASGDDVIKDCVHHGRLTKKYSQKEYRDALAHMPTDVAEYTDCRDIIRPAQLAFGGGGAGGGSGTPPAGGGAPAGRAPDPLAGATPGEAAAVKRDVASARHAGSAPRQVGGDVVTPGALAYHRIGSVSDLPTPLLVLVVLIAAATLALLAYLLRARVRPGTPGT
jgi:hypothetical protein